VGQCLLPEAGNQRLFDLNRGTCLHSPRTSEEGRLERVPIGSCLASVEVRRWPHFADRRRLLYERDEVTPRLDFFDEGAVAHSPLTAHAAICTAPPEVDATPYPLGISSGLWPM
jgi:hypothetical protein